jgi:hypothetical protein
MLNNTDDPPRIIVEEIEEVDQNHFSNNKLCGFTLYPEEKEYKPI